MTNTKIEILPRTYKISEVQRRNLLIFLDRTPIKGGEAEQIVELKKIFRSGGEASALPEQPKTQPEQTDHATT